MDDNYKKIELNEISRIYIFPNGYQLKIDEAMECFIASDGTHRLHTKKGEIIIIPARFIAIKIKENKEGG